MLQKPTVQCLPCDSTLTSEATPSSYKTVTRTCILRDGLNQYFQRDQHCVFTTIHKCMAEGRPHSNAWPRIRGSGVGDVPLGKDILYGIQTTFVNLCYFALCIDENHGTGCVNAKFSRRFAAFHEGVRGQ